MHIKHIIKEMTVYATERSPTTPLPSCYLTVLRNKGKKRYLEEIQECLFSLGLVWGSGRKTVIESLSDSTKFSLSYMPIFREVRIQQGLMLPDTPSVYTYSTRQSYKGSAMIFSFRMVEFGKVINNRRKTTP